MWSNGRYVCAMIEDENKSRRNRNDVRVLEMYVGNNLRWTFRTIGSQRFRDSESQTVRQVDRQTDTSCQPRWHANDAERRKSFVKKKKRDDFVRLRRPMERKGKKM